MFRPRRAWASRAARKWSRMRGQDPPQGRSRQGLSAAHLRRAGTRNVGRDRPENPSLITRVSWNLKDTHKSWWECDTGIAYLVSGVDTWRTRRMTEVFDLSDPTKPGKIRDFGLAGQQPGATGAVPTELHGMVSTGPLGQSHLLRLWHQQRWSAANRRSGKIADRPNGAYSRQSALSGGRPARHAPPRWRAFDHSAGQDEDRTIRQGSGRRRARHGDDRGRVRSSTSASR